MAFTIEHQFDGAKLTVIGDASGLRIVGPDRPGTLVHFVKIFHECSIHVSALHSSRPADGQLILDFEFEFEEADDLGLLMDELSKTS
jgi:prephenate dehydratase